MQADNNKLYDCVIIGGGLAGLSLSIQLVKKGHSVALIEKNEYPFHKVCGEYISMESWNFLEELGLNLSSFKLPIIKELSVTAHNGYKVSSSLKMGGFGLSRYKLDNELFILAKKAGVIVLDNCNAKYLGFDADIYTVDTNCGILRSKLVFGTYGKIEPSFIERSSKQKKGDYIGVKYHIKISFPNNLIELHNFENGYCGISMIDNETVCFCYLTTTKNLNDNNNDIKLLEKNVLMKNPHLFRYFSEAEFLFDKPLVISKISFSKKESYKNNIFMVGDSAGAIAPLCGNGMSIALRSSKIISSLVSSHLQGELSKNDLIKYYTKEWNKNFSFRIKIGYYLQKLFGKYSTTLFSIKLLSRFPILFRKLITLTHGEKF